MQRPRDCRKTMIGSSATEQRGKCEGGKKPPSRSIKRFSELFEVQKTGLSGAKRLFRQTELSLPLSLMRLCTFKEAKENIVEKVQRIILSKNSAEM